MKTKTATHDFLNCFERAEQQSPLCNAIKMHFNCGIEDILEKSYFWTWRKARKAETKLRSHEAWFASEDCISIALDGDATSNLQIQRRLKLELEKENVSKVETSFKYQGRSIHRWCRSQDESRLVMRRWHHSRPVFLAWNRQIIVFFVLSPAKSGFNVLLFIWKSKEEEQT